MLIAALLLYLRWAKCPAVTAVRGEYCIVEEGGRAEAGKEVAGVDIYLGGVYRHGRRDRGGNKCGTEIVKRLLEVGRCVSLEIWEGGEGARVAASAAFEHCPSQF